MKSQKVNLALTPGAENGVGPELLLKALLSHNYEFCEFFWCGDALSLSKAAQMANCAISFSQNQAMIADRIVVNFFADFFGESHGERQARFLEKSVALARNGMVDAIVTGPIDKTSLSFLDGGNFAGQTEFFAHYLKKDAKKPLMAFLGGPFILSLLTTHVPLTKVANYITTEAIVEHLDEIAHHARKLTKRKDVRITLLGLNPHAGEGGLIGNEEQEFFLGAIEIAKTKGLNIQGPVAADGFFAYFHRWSADEIPDVVVAIYHDQGLIPYKLLTQGLAVNATLGLKIPRVSPAHGTAYDIAGKNLACVKSTETAIKVAIELASLTAGPSPF